MKTYTITEYEMEDYDNFINSLTKEEIINRLNYIARGWLPDYNFSGTEDDFDYFKNHAVINKAIELLKREVKK